jgi:hypothetical protein
VKKLPKRNGIRPEKRPPTPSTEQTIRAALAHIVRLAVTNINETEERQISAQKRGRKGYARISIGIPFHAPGCE